MRTVAFTLLFLASAAAVSGCRGDAPATDPGAAPAVSAGAPSADPAVAVASATAARPPASSAPRDAPSGQPGAGRPTAAAPEAAPSPSICKAIVDANLMKLGGKPEPGGAEAFRTCAAGPGGAWALRVDAWDKAGDFGGVKTFRGAFTVVRLDKDGKLIATGRVGPKALYGIERGVSSTSLESPRHFDFDGDGEPELFLAAEHREREGPTTSAAALLTYQKDAIAEVAGLPKGVRRLKDADRDGRPDVVYYPFVQIRKGTCSGSDVLVEGPALLAHAIKGGTFSADDETAVKFAKRSCPAPNESKNVHPEICARLYGASEQEALAQLQKTCRPPSPGDDACSPPDGVCFDFQTRAAALRIAPPLRLQP